MDDEDDIRWTCVCRFCSSTTEMMSTIVNEDTTAAKLWTQEEPNMNTISTLVDLFSLPKLD